MKKLFVFLYIISFGGIISGMEKSKIHLDIIKEKIQLRPAEEIRKIFRSEGLTDVNEAIEFSKRYGGSYCNRDGIHFAISHIPSKSLMPVSRYELQQLIFIKCVKE